MLFFTIMDQLPQSTEIYHIPSDIGKKEIIVVFHGKTEWIGIFASNILTKKGFTGAFCLSNESADILVLSRGEGYFVNANKPGQFEPLALSPVIWAKLFSKYNLLVVVTPWEIRAMKNKKIQWETGRISIEGINIDSSTEDSIYGSVDTLEGQEQFSLNVVTGEINGLSLILFS